MYNAEVLSKFPVIQHFPFGSLFSFAKDPTATSASPSTHITSHPRAPIQPAGFSQATGAIPSHSDGMLKAPWAKDRHASIATVNAVHINRDTRRPLRNTGPSATRVLPEHIPEIAGYVQVPPTNAQESSNDNRKTPNVTPGDTKAPWAS